MFFLEVMKGRTVRKSAILPMTYLLNGPSSVWAEVAEGTDCMSMNFSEPDAVLIIRHGLALNFSRFLVCE